MNRSLLAAAAADADRWWLAPAVIAAVIAGIVAVLGVIVNGRRARLDRQRALFAEAFGDVAAYCEYPYIVRRRRDDLGGEDASRISGELSDVQRRLNHNRAVLQVEAPRVGRAYARLVEETRKVAGASIHEGWDQPLRAVGDVHVVDVDLTPLELHQARFLTAAADHLSLAPWWARAAPRAFGRWFWRWVRRQLVGLKRWAAAPPAPDGDVDASEAA